MPDAAERLAALEVRVGDAERLAALEVRVGDAAADSRDQWAAINSLREGHGAMREGLAAIRQQNADIINKLDDLKRSNAVESAACLRQENANAEAIKGLQTSVQTLKETVATMAGASAFSRWAGQLALPAIVSIAVAVFGYLMRK